MHRPTAATEAATLLLDLAAIGHALPFRVHAKPGDTPLEALTRTTTEAWDPGRFRHRRAVAWADAGVVETLPPVLAAYPLRMEGTGTLLTGHTGPGRIAGTGSYVHTGTRFRDRERLRVTVLAGSPHDAPPSPEGSRAVVVSALAARETAAAVDRWGSGLPIGKARRVYAEADTYRDYADAAEAAIPATFGWADELDSPAVTPAFQYVPVTLRGTARVGASE